MADPRQLWPNLDSACPFGLLGLPLGCNPGTVERACRRYLRGLGHDPTDDRVLQARQRLLLARELCLGWQEGWTRYDFQHWILTTCECLFIPCP